MNDERRSGMAVTSLVLGITSLLFSLLTAIPAIVCGHVAKARIRRDPEGFGGNGMATAGLILGYLHVGLVLIMIPVGIMAAVAVPLMSENRDKAMECEAIADIGMVSTAGRLYCIEEGMAPQRFEKLLSSEFLTKEDLDGNFYSSKSGWDSVVFDPAGGRVLSATLTDKDGTTKKFVFNPVNERYSVQ